MTGQAIITIAGLQALQQAISQNRQVKLKSFKVSDQDISLTPTISSLPNVWYSDDISGYFPINQNTVEFLLQVPQERMTNWGRTYGLYLENGTLFAVAKPPYAFPPGAKSIFKVQIAFQNITDHISFEYIPFSETEQDLSLLHTTSTIVTILFELKEEIERLKYSHHPLYLKLQEKINQVQKTLENFTDYTKNSNTEQKLSLLDTTSTIALIVLELKEEVERLKYSLRPIVLNLQTQINEVRRLIGRG